MIPFTEALIAQLTETLVGTLIDASGRRLRRTLADPERQQALGRCCEAGIVALIRAAGSADRGEVGHLDEVIRVFFESQEIADDLGRALVPLLRGQALDMGEIRELFEDAGFDAETLPGFDLESAFTAFAGGFAAAAVEQSALRDEIQSHLLFSRLELQAEIRDQLRGLAEFLARARPGTAAVTSGQVSAETVAGTQIVFASPIASSSGASSLNAPLTVARLRVDHLRVFDHLDFDLSSGAPGAGQWTLLLGDNAVGKTTFLRAISLACIEQQTASALLELTGITAPFVRHEAKRASVTLRTSVGEIRCSIAPNTTSERLDREGPVLPGSIFAYGCQRGTAFGGPMRDVELRPIDSVGTLFDDNAHLIHAETWLQEASLAAAKGRGSRAAFYDAIRSTLIAVLPGVESLDFDDSAQLWLDGPKIGRSPLAAMSDGYITTVGWIVDLIARWAELRHRLGVELDGDFRGRMTGLVLIDEIDLHLHPLWQTEIVSTLRRQFPKMSFVATTHNPLTLVGAKPGEIHVLRRDAETGRVSVHQQDIPPGTSADEVLTGEWFGLVSTLDEDTQNLLDQHRDMLRDGVAVDDAGRQAIEKTLRRRLGTFPSTSLDRMVQSIAAELMEGDFRRKTPEERQRIRRRILERARQEKAALRT